MKIKNLLNEQNPYCQIMQFDLNSVPVSVQKELESTMKKILMDKVREVHPYALPNKTKYKEGRQKTRVIDNTASDGRRTIWANSEDEMYMKLYEHYFTNSLTISKIWESAINEMKKTSTKNPETFNELDMEYRRFISTDFANMLIYGIDENYIKEYSRNLIFDNTGKVREPRLKESAFLSFKGILNIIFKYARKNKLISEDPLEFFDNSEYIKYCEPKKKRATDKVMSDESIKLILSEVNRRQQMNRYHGYYIFGFMIKLSIETGMRAGEICSLHWEDILDNKIWIHRQQLEQTRPLSFYEVEWTKNEKKHEGVGRYFPRTDAINTILEELKELQNLLNINSKYVFCNFDGTWITTRHYESALATVCKHLNLPKTNNHAIRMYINSYVFIPLGISVTDRAALLGHSVETNLKNYSFESHNYADNACFLLNQNALGPKLDPKNGEIIQFNAKKKAQEC